MRVSNEVYMLLSMVTTCIGEMAEQILVKPTTSLKRMVQMSNT